MPPPPALPKPAPYNPLAKSSKPEKGGLFWLGYLVPMLSLPGSPNPFQVLPKGSRASSNPFEECVQEPSLHNHTGPGEAELFLGEEVRDLTFWNLFLAMEVDKLKKQLESLSCVPKRLYRGSF